MKHKLKRLRHPVLVWVLIAPFLFGSLISNAVMPVMTDNGFVFVVCTGDGPVEMVMDLLSGEPVPVETSDDGEGCSWAAGNGPVLLPSPLALPVQLSLPRAAAPGVAQTVLAAAAATGLPPSTGPPAVF